MARSMRSAVAAWIVSSTTIFSTSADDNVARNRTEISRAKGKHRRMVTPPRMRFYCLAKRDLTKTLKSAVNKNSDQYETVETGSGYVHRSEPKPKAQTPKPKAQSPKPKARLTSLSDASDRTPPADASSRAVYIAAWSRGVHAQASPE